MTARPPKRRSAVYGRYIAVDRTRPVAVVRDLTWAVIADLDAAIKRKRGDYRGLVLRQLAAGLHPTRGDLLGALKQRPPTVQSVTLPPEQTSYRANVQRLVVLYGMTAAAAEAYVAEHALPFVSDDEFRANLDRAFAEAQAAIDRDTATIHDYIGRHYLADLPRRPGRRPRTVQPTISATERWAITFEYFMVLARLEAARVADDRAPRNVAWRAREHVRRKFGYLRLSHRTLQALLSGARLYRRAQK